MPKGFTERHVPKNGDLVVEENGEHRDARDRRKLAFCLNVKWRELNGPVGYRVSHV